ncbi:MAG: GAF domain-containing protein [Nitrospirae bacterium]|nr:GAF domain-containing protein [Nitrospirota bacterium]
MVFCIVMEEYIKELKTIEKKRWELLSLELIILGFLTCAVIVLSILEQKYLTLFFLGLLTTLFSIYLINKEKEFKRLNANLTEEQFKNIEERIRTASVKERLNEVVLLYKVGRISVSSLSLQKKLDKILHIAFNLVNADRASIMLPNDVTGNFIIASSINFDEAILRTVLQKIDDGVAGWVLKNKTPLILTGKIEDNQIKNLAKKKDEINSAISLPIKLKGKVIGVMNMSYLVGTDRVFTEHHLRLLSIFTRYIATTMEHTQLAIKKQLIPS